MGKILKKIGAGGGVQVLLGVSTVSQSVSTYSHAEADSEAHQNGLFVFHVIWRLTSVVCVFYSLCMNIVNS